MSKQEYIDLLELLNKLEIRGEQNIFFMYKIMAFIRMKIEELEKRTEAK